VTRWRFIITSVDAYALGLDSSTLETNSNHVAQSDWNKYWN